MNYHKIYESLIKRGRSRNLECYTESHHIVPRCMGGSDDKENLVNLTPEEHYLAHQLLVKMYPNNHALIKAASMMIPNRPSNKMYGWLKRKFSEVQSISQSGQGNSQFSTLWINNGKENKKIKSGSNLEPGWVKGRIRINPPKFNEIQKCNGCVKKEIALYWYELYCKSESKSLRDFARKSNYKKSHVSLINMFKKYIPEFEVKHGKPHKS